MGASASEDAPVGDFGVPDLRAGPPWWLGRPSDALHYRVYARAYAVATLLRLTLPDAMQWSWLPAASVQGAGAILLLVNGSLLGWVLCAAGALWGIVGLQDQLTQSAYLLACAVAAISCFAGSRAGRQARMARGLPHAVRLLTLLVYGLAALHKINHDFFDPAVSCANGGLRALVSHGYATARLPEGVLGSAWWPRLFLGAELAMPLVAWRRPGWAVALLALFHLPLTIIFAPGFAFTMMSGWICLLDERQLRGLVVVGRRRWRWILAAAALPATLSAILFFPARWGTDPDWRLKEILLWIVAAWALETVTTPWRDGRMATRGGWAMPVAAPAVGGVVALAFLLHGLTPYVGLGFHRTGAMLSNLRIDEGCHNSLLFPEALRGADPFVRIDAITFAPGRAVDGFAEQVTDRLWSVPALWRARAHWCRTHEEPLPLRARFEGRVLEVDDLCADPWPFPAVRLSGMRRFQVNLTERCPQVCIH